jgi:hypothetical protein
LLLNVVGIAGNSGTLTVTGNSDTRSEKPGKQKGTPMLTVKEIGTNVHEITLQGVIEKSDIENMEQALVPLLEGDRRFGLVVRTEKLEDMTAGALAGDAKFEFSMLSRWSKVAKLAVVSDLHVFAALTKWINPVFPMIEMQSFGSEQVAEAHKFASDLPVSSETEENGTVKILSDGTDGLIAFEVRGRVSREDAQAVMQPLEAALERDQQVDLLVKLDGYDGFDPGIMADRSFMKTKFSSIRNLRRYALVGAPSWMKAMASTMALAMPFEMRFFDQSEEENAWRWVKES